MEDPIVGGYDERGKALRQAIAYAVDMDEFNETFYEGLCLQYDGPIPPGLDGHPEDHILEGAPRGPDLQKARELLAKAGYPNGEGLPPIRYYTNSSSINAQMTDLLRRQLSEIGVELDTQLVDFSQLIELTNKKQAPMFSFAWLTDYPDGENNLALFYSKNVSPGSNHWNYNKPEFDALYEQAIVMEPSAERTALYEEMRDMVIEDVPMVGSLARTRYYVYQPWLANARPTERFWSWFKYLGIDESQR
jgi:oligopeptide transport system substrate-binding protein